MAKNTNTPAPMVFEDEESMAPRGSRGTSIPDALLDAVETRTPKSVTVPDAEAAKNTRALVRRAADSLAMGVDTSQESLADGRVKVYFMGRDKRGYNK